MRKSIANAPAASERVALALREAPQELDEISRARMERNLIEAWRARGAHAVPLRGWMPARMAVSRTVWMGSLAASAALGAVLGLVLLRGHGSQGGDEAPAPERMAHFDLVIGDGAVQSGWVVAGQVLESGKRGHIEVGVEQTRIDIAPDSRVRFERLDRDELRLSLVQGRVDVAFHPVRPGEQSLAVETSAARVVVVGTRFAVEADAVRATRVSVSEGVVRVEPRRGGEVLMVHAGEQVTVPLLVQPSGSIAPLVVPTEPARQGARASSPAHPPRSRGQVEGSDSKFEKRLEAARRLLLVGKHGAARERLQRMIKGSSPPGARVEALVLMAESFTAQGQVQRAAAAYRQAVETAPKDVAGHNAMFALARLLDRYTHDDSVAAAAYREYLTKAPRGALAPQAKDALCRLGAGSGTCR